MLNKVKRLMKNLRRNISGNAMLLLALGMPVMIGGAGLAVDTARWYMWQREMQYAVDQAALAGAWARTVTANQSTYSARAVQEYNANMQMADAFDAAPTVSLSNYNGGTNNAVTVAASASRKLPFSSFLTKDNAITVAVTATASVTPGVAGTSTTTITPARSACVIALNPTASGALTLGGSASGTVSCGGAALSSNPTAAIDELGNPDLVFSSLTATGGIDPTLANNVTGGTANMFSNQTGLSDPFGSLSPTGSATPQSYPGSCPTATSAVTKATTTPTTMVSYIYVTASNTTNAESYAAAGTNTYAGTMSSPYRRAAVNTTGAATNNVTVANGTVNGQTVDGAITYTDQGVTTTSGVREVKKSFIRTAYSNVVYTPATTSTVTLQPGTYANIVMACDTIFSPGIYTITGSIDFSNNRSITGSDVMFVMKTANNISNINSNTNIFLTGISASTLTGTYGYSATDANKLAGMLFWDPLSTSSITFNGNAVAKMNGAIYMPHRSITFQGNVSVAGYCMMVIGDMITFTGSNDVTSFCKTSGASVPEVRPQTSVTTTTPATPAQVRLVS
jgi:Flp pilus assembly protein TadG